MHRTRTFLCIEAVICGLPLAALMVLTAPEFLVATVGFVLSRPQALPGTSGLALSAHAAVIQVREIRASTHT